MKHLKTENIRFRNSTRDQIEKEDATLVHREFNSLKRNKLPPVLFKPKQIKHNKFKKSEFAFLPEYVLVDERISKEKPQERNIKTKVVVSRLTVKNKVLDIDLPVMNKSTTRFKSKKKIDTQRKLFLKRKLYGL